MRSPAWHQLPTAPITERLLARKYVRKRRNPVKVYPPKPIEGKYKSAQTNHVRTLFLLYVE
jgi:hypothetical protein